MPAQLADSSCRSPANPTDCRRSAYLGACGSIAAGMQQSRRSIPNRRILVYKQPPRAPDDGSAVVLVVRSKRQLETGAHFCSGRIVSRSIASTGHVGKRAIGEMRDPRRQRR